MTKPVRDDAWMLQEVMELPETVGALLISADGLVRAQTRSLGKDAADRIAAALSGLRSTAVSMGGMLPQPPVLRQTLLDFDTGFVLAIDAGEGTYLCAAATRTADVEQVGFRMHEVVAAMGREMVSAPRRDGGTAA
ncbi:roadblock/LC7 domain-containing protein [Streptomyces aidingensis]|uniref:Predicted regulator of Ras-like GTPase activity, Roadblock/LC7/MglB family n=1 Tax=Streptomyces aidingensis TaxID=910347 RepID=A0A1I1VHX0_9ACTN|nr:roadblock/LC7 domain-containing protein [Streptomyces aidingensis]SFD80070.1 Predicted regulator of Ras-like GTPase activity, Roadblock/LC7/MglB family [Streptomyces aidingensis]